MESSTISVRTQLRPTSFTRSDPWERPSASSAQRARSMVSPFAAGRRVPDPIEDTRAYTAASSASWASPQAENGSSASGCRSSGVV
ncbi:hypothetical protein [Nonomuraea longicatena]|uniref:Uncharacterized protein n=1 Tax=Nonomuraea longicatena TaxID=83682 RepID=A0ABN1Q9H2_9ACTN